jgi:HK97 family phage portal protein
MGLFDPLITGGQLMAGTPGPTDDYWYNPVGTMTAAGVKVDSEGAQKLSAWFRGRWILAMVLAMLPLHVFRKLANDGGSEVAKDHPLEDVLHDQPSSFQNSFEWRVQKMFDLIDTGWSFDWIIEGARGFAHELQHIERRLVRPERIKSGPSKGRYLFHVTDETTGRTTVHTQDEIFYLRGPEGKGILERARQSIGLALATEQFSASVFGKGMLNGGTIEVPGVLNDEAGRRMALSFLTKPGEWSIPKVLEQGSKWNKPEMSPEDFETILSRKFSIDDMARWLGVPRQMLENSDPSFGNAEQFDESFLTYSMGGWLALFEFAFKSQLILNTKVYYVQFVRQAFVRGKFSERIAGLVLAAGGPIMTRNEARGVEDLKKLDGDKYDELVEQQNVTGKPSPNGNGPGTVPAPPQRRAPEPDKKAQAIATSAAARLLQVEVNAIRKLAVKHGKDENEFAAAVTEFYAAHVARIGDALQMSDTEAEAYCSGQSSQVLAGWLAACDVFKTDDYAQGLAALALGEAA